MEIKAVKINMLNTETFMPGQWIRVLPRFANCIESNVP